MACKDPDQFEEAVERAVATRMSDGGYQSPFIGDESNLTFTHFGPASLPLVDDSVPEEMNPHKLQERIIELENELSALRGNSNPDAISFSADGRHGVFTPCYSGYAGAEDLFTLNAPFDLTMISMVSDPEEECKIVSSEEANYERAMSMIGK